MKIIRPVTILDAQLISSDVPEPATGINPDPALWTGATSYAVDAYAYYGHRIYKCILAAPAVAVSISAGGLGQLYSYAPAHGLANDTPIVLYNGAGAVPANLVQGTTYYVVSATTDNFYLATTIGGSPVVNASGSGVTRACFFRSVARTAPPNEVLYWRDVAATNRWKMFDGTIGSQTTKATSLSVTVAPGIIHDSMALFGCTGNTVRVRVTGTAYDVTVDLKTRSVASVYDYFYEPYYNRPDCAFWNMPTDAAHQVVIDVTADSGQVAGIGLLQIGLSKDIGRAAYGTSFGVRDYSVKTTDEFGQTSVTERAYSSRSTVQLEVDNTFLNEFKRLLSYYRSTPIVWCASDSYDATLVYGYAKDFDVVISRPTVSDCQLAIEGIT